MKTILLFLFAIVAIHSFASNFYVSPNGNNQNNGLTITPSFLTIESAVYVVSPGDSVLIRNGIYTKNAPESLIAYVTISGNADYLFASDFYSGIYFLKLNESIFKIIKKGLN